ncbi:carboxypeptidase M32 [Caenispirillum salinarum]|uniref:carboxypeptidase M32 n=1 Tax=Caenispirillum salinarum TaxID=859058 RepID=UPI0038504440
MAANPSPYHQLETRFARLSALGDAAGFLHWDAATMMPDGGADSRADQLATLSAIEHEMTVDPRVAEWIAAAEARADDLDAWQKANLREIARLHAHASAVPAHLVEALSRAGSSCEMTWRTARPASDFAAVAPKLKIVLDLTREMAEAKAEALGVTPYDALLDQYEPGGRADSIDMLFADLESVLPNLLGEVLEAQGRRPPPVRPKGPFPIATQKAVAARFMKTLGFDFAHGRLDVSAHPFCGGSSDDLRLTTRYEEDDFAQAFMGVLHETGHALYEQGLPADWRKQPVGKARGMSMHESQSLLTEMLACRSRSFAIHAAPVLREAFGGGGQAWEAENLYRLNTLVEPGFIRVDADEVTYPAHVILRYRLERDLIAGRLEIDDLPEAWNEGMQRLLGLTVPDDRRGVLQDIHWYDGAFGYFPTYTLGAMTAAQLFLSACDAEPRIPDCLAVGDFRPLLGWLRQNVHRHGSSLSTRELLVQATGEPLSAKAFLTHLRGRYLED